MKCRCSIRHAADVGGSTNACGPRLFVDLQSAAVLANLRPRTRYHKQQSAHDTKKIPSLLSRSDVKKTSKQHANSLRQRTSRLNAGLERNNASLTCRFTLCPSARSSSSTNVCVARDLLTPRFLEKYQLPNQSPRQYCKHSQ